MPVKPPRPKGDSQTTYIPMDIFSHINIFSLAGTRMEEVCSSVVKYSASTDWAIPAPGLFFHILIRTDSDHYTGTTIICDQRTVRKLTLNLSKSFLTVQWPRGCLVFLLLPNGMELSLKRLDTWYKTSWVLSEYYKRNKDGVAKFTCLSSDLMLQWELVTTRNLWWMIVILTRNNSWHGRPWQLLRNQIRAKVKKLRWILRRFSTSNLQIGRV